MSLKKVVILFSGEGSNLENLIATLHQKTFGTTTIEVVAAITNKPTAKGIEKANKYGVDSIILDHTEFDSREAFDTKLVETIQNLEVELTVMAGFMRILTPIFTNNIQAINIHPSLLPLFKGASALERSFESDMQVAGVSVHEVITEVDGGKIIAQKCFDKSEMDFATFKAKIHQTEHEIFPEAVIKVLQTI
ncbi:MAG: phosphoribosylglycinamide formyltransferase [Epsilonproteobacteria bacterium]|nr:phosphoribosylglycinamide formyltransferase [Campylobacterota bacterium]